MNHVEAYLWLHGDSLEYSGCRSAAEVMGAEINRLSKRHALFVERLEKMQKNADHWLTATAVLALLYDCERKASKTPEDAPVAALEREFCNDRGVLNDKD